MADATIDSELIRLECGQWGPARYALLPQDGFTGALHHNVAAAAYPLGTVLAVWNDGAAAGVSGLSEFVYLQIETTGAPTHAVKQVVTQDVAGTPMKVTNDPDSAVGISGMPCAVSISAMTDAYYGWFWCGGVCPEEFVSALGGTYATDDSVTAGDQLQAQDLAADAIGFGLRDTTENRVGWADTADS